MRARYIGPVAGAKRHVAARMMTGGLDGDLMSRFPPWRRHAARRV
jgi:hypothetical protein